MLIMMNTDVVLSDGALRREGGETVLDGEKLLGEALASGAEVG